MKITKETFVYILGILEDNYFINFNINNSENSVEVINIEDGSWQAYKFDNNNYLINPQIEKLQQKIKDLQEEQKRLEEKIKNLSQD